MDRFGIFDPQMVRRVKEEWQRTTAEVRKAAAPLVDEAERIAGTFFRPASTGPGTPLDGCDWQRVPDDEEALRERLARTIADLTVVTQHAVTLDEPGGAAARFVVRVTLTDGATWQAQVPVAAVARATEAELRLW